MIALERTMGAAAAICVSADDNVAVACRGLAAGDHVLVSGREIVMGQSVPLGHKFAVEEIAAASPVRRYGEIIGAARQTIRTGEHVHTHNLAFSPGLRAADNAASYRPAIAETPRDSRLEFLGYARPDGRTGTRNYVAVAAASNCSAHVVEEIASAFAGRALPANVDGVVAFPHGDGCGHTIGRDTQQLERTLRGLLDHPNVGGAVLVGLGCEVNRLDLYLPGGVSPSGKVCGLCIQEEGGTRATVRTGVAAVERAIEGAAAARRTAAPASALVLGLNCGGSDSFSGLTANPALGVCADLLALHAGTAVLAETPETFGAEHILARRARTPEVAARLLAVMDEYKRYLDTFGASFDDNPSPGNKDGGLTNVVEKSLGAVAKGGSTPLENVIGYAERIPSPGLVFMNTPGYDPVSLTGLAAGGANIIAFTTGRGSAIGFPVVPVIKIASNTGVFERMRDNMDVNAGRILSGGATIREVGAEIFDLLLRVASGERTASERLKHAEFVPWRIGPVL